VWNRIWSIDTVLNYGYIVIVFSVPFYSLKISLPSEVRLINTHAIA